jgi:hypothetical protein
MYDHRTGRTSVLLDRDQRADLERVRRELEREPEVCVDHRYRGGVRAWRLSRGRRRGLEPELVALVLRRAGAEERVRPIPGWAQTDFMVAGVDKGTGLSALAEALGEPADGRFLALAVGDGEPDLDMFRHARLACAPANAGQELRAAAGVRIMRRPYQAGLLEAVERLLGRRAEPPALEGDRRLLMTMLGGQDRGRAGKLLQGVRLAMEARR